MAPGRQGHGQGDIQELAPKRGAGSVQTDPISQDSAISMPQLIITDVRISRDTEHVFFSIKNPARFRDLRFEPLVILVAHEDEIARAQRESPAEVLRETEVALVTVEPDREGGPRGELGQGGPGGIERGVVGDHQLVRWTRLTGKRLKLVPQVLLPVVGGHRHRYAHSHPPPRESLVGSARIVQPGPCPWRWLHERH